MNKMKPNKITIVLKNGEHHEAELECCDQNGSDIYIIDFQNGDKYEGDWKDGQKHGQGVYTWKNGDRYEGGWKNGKAHGKGVFTRADGTKNDGEFENGSLVYTDGHKITCRLITGSYKKGC